MTATITVSNGAPLEQPPQAQFLMPITRRPGQVFVRGTGDFLWDQAGRKYLDFVQGWAVNTLGHSPAVVRDALMHQAASLLTASPAYFNQPSLDLAERICSSSGFDQVFFANSGAEANEGAIKLARRWGAATGRYEIITFEGGFHGRTLACMSASGKPQFEPLFEPKVSGFSKARLNDIDSVKQLMTDKTVAVMLEPIQGEAGVFEATPAFMKALGQLARDTNLLLIMDEIQSGVGRTGWLWDHQRTGVQPDIMTLGKGLGAGVPVSALVATERASCFEPGDQGGTWCGNPLMCAVADVVLAQVSNQAFLERVRASGKHLESVLHALSERHHLGEVRGHGLLRALNTGSFDAAALSQAAMDRGLLLNAPRTDTLRFMPALNVSEAHIDLMGEVLDGVFADTVSA